MAKKQAATAESVEATEGSTRVGALHQAHADYIKEHKGVDVTAEQVFAVYSTRVAFRKSEAYQNDVKAAKAAEKEQAAKVKEEAKAAREAERKAKAEAKEAEKAAKAEAAAKAKAEKEAASEGETAPAKPAKKAAAKKGGKGKAKAESPF